MCVRPGSQITILLDYIHHAKFLIEKHSGHILCISQLGVLISVALQLCPICLLSIIKTDFLIFKTNTLQCLITSRKTIEVELVGKNVRFY